jgi:hypothetical protein
VHHFRASPFLSKYADQAEDAQIAGEDLGELANADEAAAMFGIAKGTLTAKKVGKAIGELILLTVGA